MLLASFTGIMYPQDTQGASDIAEKNPIMTNTRWVAWE